MLFQSITLSHFLLVEFVDRQLIVVLTDNGVSYLPDLQHVVFSCAGYQPWLVGVPAEISQVIGMSSVHEKAGEKEKD